MRKGVVFALGLAAASAARGQDSAAGNHGSSSGGGGGTSDHFERACVDLLHGHVPKGGPQAIRTLKDACDRLMSARADDEIRAEERRKADVATRETSAQASRSSGQVQQGQGVLAAFEQAGRELTGPQRTLNMGYRRGGPVDYTLVTNPIGWFNGVGVNAELFHPIDQKFSWVAGARYSTTDTSNGTASTFGVMGGLDLFVFGQYNEGLRIGPRVEFAAGRENFVRSTTFARIGLAGELGYNFIATNGVTAVLAAGLGGRVAGDAQNDGFASFVGGEFGPYLKVGLGWSW
ncbi:MAG TPA: hypothetical protein VIW03_00870 [Anaeromyxobacter sp.]